LAALTAVFGLSTAAVTTAAAAGTPGQASYLGADGSHGDGDNQLDSPEGVGVDSAGNVYVADSLNDRVVEFSSSGDFVSTWGWGVADGRAAYETCTEQCGPGTLGSGAGQLSTAQGLAVSGGDVFVADSANNRVVEYTTTGDFVRAWGWGVADGAAALETCTSSPWA
jgi:DNA-binding beta-propeller fold protein YncE